MSKDATEAIAKKLQDFMEAEKPYLQDDISLQMLADKIQVPPNQLSQAINQELQMNFYDYVNSFRVEEFLTKRNDPANKHFTLLAIALDSGFPSKASFNRNFKKVTGKSPSQYTDPQE